MRLAISTTSGSLFGRQWKSSGIVLNLFLNMDPKVKENNLQAWLLDKIITISLLFIKVFTILHGCYADQAVFIQICSFDPQDNFKTRR